MSSLLLPECPHTILVCCDGGHYGMRTLLPARDTLLYPPPCAPCPVAAVPRAATMLQPLLSLLHPSPTTTLAALPRIAFQRTGLQPSACLPPASVLPVSLPPASIPPASPIGLSETGIHIAQRGFGAVRAALAQFFGHTVGDVPDGPRGEGEAMGKDVGG